MWRCVSALSVLLLLTSGCKEVAKFQVGEELAMIVKEVRSDKDTYLAVVAFQENTEYEDIIQEVKITNPRGVMLQLVESFDTSWSSLSEDSKFKTDFDPPTVGDHHWSERASGWERRDCRFYAAEVEGVDRDMVGFAMLPANMDGSFRTKVGKNVNSHYQKNQEITGRIVRRHHETGVYRIEWEPYKLKIVTSGGTVSYDRGKVKVRKSAQMMAEAQERNRRRSFMLKHGRFHIPRAQRIAEKAALEQEGK